MAEDIVNLANDIVAMKPDITITISEIVTRGDKKDLDSKGKSVNNSKDSKAVLQAEFVENYYPQQHSRETFKSRWIAPY